MLASNFLMAWKNSYDKTQREKQVNDVYTGTVLFFKKEHRKNGKIMPLVG